MQKTLTTFLRVKIPILSPSCSWSLAQPLYPLQNSNIPHGSQILFLRRNFSRRIFLPASQPQPKPNPKRVPNPAIEPLSIRLRTQTAGEAPFQGRYACLATLFTPRCQTAIFFRYAQKRSLRFATFTKSPTLSPRPPPSSRLPLLQPQLPAEKFPIRGAVFSRMSILKAAHYVQKHSGFCIPIRSKTALDNVQATLA